MATITRMASGKMRVRVKDGDYVKQATVDESDVESAVRALEYEISKYKQSPPAVRVCREYLQYKQGRMQPQSWERLRSTVEKHIIPRITGLRWCQIDSVLVNDIVNNTPLSYSSVKKIKEGFSGCDKYALTCGLSDKSIMYGVELRKRAPTPKVEIYDSKEVREIVSAAENDKYGVVFLFLLYTGLRAGEMCALTWADINKWSVWVDKTAVTRNGNTIIQPSPKSTASIRSIPLSSKCLSLLPRIQEFWGGGPTVISKKNGEPLNPAALSHAFRRFCAKNGISKKKNSLHSLRDTFASTLINAGADLITVSKLLGHADSRVTEHHYICVADGKKREAVALLSY